MSIHRQAAKDRGQKIDVVEMELQLKLIHMPLVHCEKRAATVRNQLWWITMYLRYAYRHLHAYQLRYSDTEARLEWTALEASLVR